ncbi:MAG TPA: phosphoribosylamine--glycine ligase [Desulfitobacterium dehalogenans]|uniref:Phosphoribosylamine--glycine ligase n=1 Tax=Desulfitobacterium dehalogenans TaxID=36854 RepID=A0A7C7D586_9FIRM|nr:phosphoribosylamine--glycine ligase [Desulfitobacterium dehalogenans]
MAKKVLVVGNGGREHALAWKIAQSPEVGKLYVAPGNAGTREWNVAISATDIPGLLEFAQKEGIDLTIVGPEAPLTLGIVDAFQKEGLRIFGPTQGAARLEGSKSFAKEIMDEAGVPTAQSRVFSEPEKAKEYIKHMGAPVVLKADGLAAGKGVIVAMDLDTALTAVDELMDGSLGESGKLLLIEEYLEGQEVSLLCLCDGEHAVALVPVQDHKRALDGDQGLNTGGMGTYSPPPFWNVEMEEEALRTIVHPTLKVMKDKGMPFQGVLFAGLMLTKNGPKTLEFNVRFGDPETQVVMARMESDLFEVLWACTEGQLKDLKLEWKKEKAICIVMAAPGYPMANKKGIPIALPEVFEQGEVIFHAGTSLSQDGELQSSGGRVLGVTVLGDDLNQARQLGYALAERIDFPGAHYRKDIGVKGL